MNRASEAADLLAEIVERGKTTGRPDSDHELEDVLAAALDPFELARLVAVSRTRLGFVRRAENPARAAAIAAGLLRPKASK